MRAGGRCELCNRDLGWTSEYSKHHRRPRGMGGTKATWVNAVSNLLLVCGTGVTGCHGMIESQRAIAYERGWLVRTGFAPNEVPVLLHGARLVYLDDDGRYAEGSP
ncbi:MAG: HNH endonuclease [Actinobacteria bacterium]|nr:HNH endonuclease [Actinomycetota bacterium]